MHYSIVHGIVACIERFFVAPAEQEVPQATEPAERMGRLGSARWLPVRAAPGERIAMLGGGRFAVLPAVPVVHVEVPAMVSEVPAPLEGGSSADDEA
eukprot:4154077-Alexandrium_andersonii.AAC.1